MMGAEMRTALVIDYESLLCVVPGGEAVPEYRTFFLLTRVADLTLPDALLIVVASKHFVSTMVQMNCLHKFSSQQFDLLVCYCIFKVVSVI
jgi:hypothetical protein